MFKSVSFLSVSFCHLQQEPFLVCVGKNLRMCGRILNVLFPCDDKDHITDLISFHRFWGRFNTYVE